VSLRVLNTFCRSSHCQPEGRMMLDVKTLLKRIASVEAGRQ